MRKLLIIQYLSDLTTELRPPYGWLLVLYVLEQPLERLTLASHALNGLCMGLIVNLHTPYVLDRKSLASWRESV